MPNKQMYWFKRRRYGYGWTPVTWQGWAALGLFGIVLAIGVSTVSTMSSVASWQRVGAYVLTVVLPVIILLWTCFKKSPRPKWRWGAKDSDNPDEDF